MSDKINTSPEALDTIVKELTDPCEASGTNDLGLLIAALDIERDALSARVAELEAKNRELALEVISANGQAFDAYDAQKDAEARIEELETKLAKANKTLSRMVEGWGNALELDIIAPQHRTSAGILRDEARATLAKIQDG